MATESDQSNSKARDSQPADSDVDANQSMSQSSDFSADEEETADTQPQLDEQSSLQDLLDTYRRQLAQVEEDGEEIKQIIAELLTANIPDHQVAGETQEFLAGSLGQFHEEHDEVRLPEIVFALWLELNRAITVFTGAAEANSDNIDEEKASSAEQPDNAEAMVSESLPFDSDDSDDSSDVENDEESDDPMRISVRMFQ